MTHQVNDASRGAGHGQARGTGRHSCFRFPRPASERCRPTPHHAFLTPSSERQVSAERGPPAASPRPAPAQASGGFVPGSPATSPCVALGAVGSAADPAPALSGGAVSSPCCPPLFFRGCLPRSRFSPRLLRAVSAPFSSAVPGAPLSDGPHSHRRASLSSAGRLLPPRVRSGFGGGSPLQCSTPVCCDLQND